MSQIRTSPFLRLALLLDAGVSGATGLLMVILSVQLGEFLQLPRSLLLYAGLFLLPYAGVLAYLANREALPRWAVWAVVVGNVAWAADCVLLAFSGWVSPSLLGYGFILMQAIVVIAFAELQYVGMRRSVVSRSA
jgi:hypothetical protein